MPDNNLLESRQLEGLKGRRLGPYMSHNPVSATQIWQWCSAMGDNNPGYRPGDKQVAPRAMMQMWTMRDINDQYAPGSTDDPPYQVFDDIKRMGYPANVAVSYDITFKRCLLVGERVKHYTSIVEISEKKITRLGTGFFVTERVEYLTLDDILFADALITYFQYQPAEAMAEGVAGPSPLPGSWAPAGESPAKGSSSWQSDYRNIDVANISVGDSLPERCIPITHKLIVGGAIATQDFIPVHHNVPAALAAGMPDIFMNILTTSGLSACYLGDWAGAASRLETISFNLMTPNFPGDRMVMGGEITAIEQDSSGTLMTVAFHGKNRLGIHISGTAILALPSTNTTT